jgi:hypothetical protein
VTNQRRLLPLIAMLAVSEKRRRRAIAGAERSAGI